MQQRSVATLRAALAAVLTLACALVSVPAGAAPATGTRQAVEPRFDSAWVDLLSALWMLTHSDAVHATDPNYKRATQSLYAAIGALDDGIINSSRRAPVPKVARDGKVRLHAALTMLAGADRELSAPTRDANAEPLRARALAAARAASDATRKLISACRC